MTPYQLNPRRAGDDLNAAPSPMKISLSCSVEQPELKKQRLGQSHDDGFTALSELIKTIKLRHKVQGKVVMFGRSYYIQYDGERLAKFSFLIFAQKMALWK